MHISIASISSTVADVTNVIILIIQELRRIYSWPWPTAKSRSHTFRLPLVHHPPWSCDCYLLNAGCDDVADRDQLAVALICDVDIYDIDYDIYDIELHWPAAVRWRLLWGCWFWISVVNHYHLISLNRSAMAACAVADVRWPFDGILNVTRILNIQQTSGPERTLQRFQVQPSGRLQLIEQQTKFVIIRGTVNSSSDNWGTDCCWMSV